MTAPTIKPSTGFTLKELAVLEFLKNNTELSLWGVRVFGPKIYAGFVHDVSDQSAERLLSNMVRRGLIRRVRKGVYAGNEGAK